MNKLASIVAIAGIAAAANASGINLERIGAIDLTGAFTDAGQKPLSIAWNGSELYAGAYNTTSSAALVDMVRVDGAFTGSETFTNFGASIANGFDGFRGMDINGDRLAVTYRAGTGAPYASVSTWDTNDLSAPLWSNAMPDPRNGIAFDPTDGNTAYGRFGSGRLQKQDATTGAQIWDTATGPVIFAGDGTAYQGMDFSPSGDIYIREGIDIISAQRTGADSFTGLSIIKEFNEPNESTEDNRLFHNLVYIPLPTGDVVLYNDRNGGASGQDMADVLLAIDANGNDVQVDFANAPSFFTNAGLLDFSYDANTGTLAVMEWFSNRVYLYNVVPAPGAMALLGLGGLAAARRRRA